ncbi:MAG: hypothetical protein Q8865_02350 [Bacillota bacterium]|nr:hypothetical protein [Bacillota bacterium]
MNPTLKFLFKALWFTVMAAIICLLIGATFGIISQGGILKWILTFANALIYISIHYSFGWNQGLRDRNEVKFNHQKENYFKGFLAGAFTFIPSAILLIGFFLSHIDNNTSSFFNIALRTWLYAFIEFIIYFINHGTKVYIALLALIAPLTLGISYILGYRELSVVRGFTAGSFNAFNKPVRNDSAKSILNEKNLRNLKKKK